MGVCAGCRERKGWHRIPGPGWKGWPGPAWKEWHPVPGPAWKGWHPVPGPAWKEWHLVPRPGQKEWHPVPGPGCTQYPGQDGRDSTQRMEGMAPSSQARRCQQEIKIQRQECLVLVAHEFQSPLPFPSPSLSSECRYFRPLAMNLESSIVLPPSMARDQTSLSTKVMTNQQKRSRFLEEGRQFEGNGLNDSVIKCQGGWIVHTPLSSLAAHIVQEVRFRNADTKGYWIPTDEWNARETLHGVCNTLHAVATIVYVRALKKFNLND